MTKHTRLPTLSAMTRKEKTTVAALILLVAVATLVVVVVLQGAGDLFDGQDTLQRQFGD